MVGGVDNIVCLVGGGGNRSNCFYRSRHFEDDTRKR
jgi:hypothetical protein